MSRSTSAPSSSFALRRKQSKSAQEEEQHSERLREQIKLSNFWSGVRGIVGIQSSHHVNPKSLLSNVDGNNHTSQTKTVALNNKKALSDLRLFHPNGMLKMTWEIVSAYAVLYTCLEVPFRIAFVANQAKHNVLNSLEYIVVIIFLLDILVAFNTAYIERTTNLLVTDRKIIAKKYLTSFFWLDLISAIPWDVTSLSNVKQSHLEAIRMLRFLRLMRMSKAFSTNRLVRNRLDKWGIDPAFSNVIVLVFQIFYMAHLVCCFWFYITVPDATGNPSSGDDDTIGESSDSYDHIAYYDSMYPYYSPRHNNQLTNLPTRQHPLSALI